MDSTLESGGFRCFCGLGGKEIYLSNFCIVTLTGGPFYNWPTEDMYCPGEKIWDSVGCPSQYGALYLLSTDLA